MALPKYHRIVEEKTIKKTFHSKHRASSKMLNFWLYPNQSRFRFLVVVSKKISKSAVVRNRIKRRIIALFEQKLKNKEPLGNFNLSIQVKNKDIIKLSQAELIEDLEPALKYMLRKVGDRKPKPKTISDPQGNRL